MSYYRKKKHRTCADIALYRIYMIRSWRDYKYYSSSSNDCSYSFRQEYLRDYDSFCMSNCSLRSYLANIDKTEKLVLKVFGEENDFSYRREILERIKKNKKHGKAKLIRGHLFDDEMNNGRGRTHIDPPHISIPNTLSDKNTGTNTLISDVTLKDIIKKLVDLELNLCDKNS